jgi:hypothetical protein
MNAPRQWTAGRDLSEGTTHSHRHENASERCAAVVAGRCALRDDSGSRTCGTEASTTWMRAGVAEDRCSGHTSPSLSRSREGAPYLRRQRLTALKAPCLTSARNIGACEDPASLSPSFKPTTQRRLAVAGARPAAATADVLDQKGLRADHLASTDARQGRAAVPATASGPLIYPPKTRDKDRLSVASDDESNTGSGQVNDGL